MSDRRYPWPEREGLREGRLGVPDRQVVCQLGDALRLGLLEPGRAHEVLEGEEVALEEADELRIDGLLQRDVDGLGVLAALIEEHALEQAAVGVVHHDLLAPAVELAPEEAELADELGDLDRLDASELRGDDARDVAAEGLGEALDARGEHPGLGACEFRHAGRR